MIKITYYGHSSFLLEIAGKRIVFDPFFRSNPKASHIGIHEIKPDYVFVSHGHIDHLEDAEFLLNSTDAILVSNFEIVNWFVKKGVKNCHSMNLGGSKKFDFGKVKFVNAIHSSTLPDGSSGGNPGGFVIKSDLCCFYYAGDTALSYDMKLINEEFDVDFAFLPIGDNYTMGVADAIKAADFVGTDKIIGMHYNTFPDIEIDMESVKKSAIQGGKELILLNIGESITL
jgi:L-ascorbate metabolism protein UlaG (beta-lactamase superfamily)